MAEPRSTASGQLLEIGAGRKARTGDASSTGNTRTASVAEPDERDETSGPTTEEAAPDTSQDSTREEGLPPGPTSSVGLVASELADAVLDFRQLLGEMSGADRGTVWAAVGLVASTLAPFVGVPGDPWRPGIMAGGWALVLLAVWALQLTAARARAMGLVEGGMGDLAERETSTLRRISLLHLLCGALATAYAAYLLVFHLYLMDARTVQGVPLRPYIRPGLPVALFFSTGLAFAGLARFRADARRRRSRR